MLPFSPYDLPGWECLLIAAGFAIVAVLTHAVASPEPTRRKGGAPSGVITLVFDFIFHISSLATLLCFIFGLVRLVKESWYR